MGVVVTGSSSGDDDVEVKKMGLIFVISMSMMGDARRREGF